MKINHTLPVDYCQNEYQPKTHINILIIIKNIFKIE